MSFFGSVADTFGLNFKRTSYRRKLKKLANKIEHFCKFRPIIHNNTSEIEKSCYNIYNYIKTYTELTSNLHNLLFELCKALHKL